MAIRINLPEMGEGQYIELKDPKFLSWGVQKEITSLVVGEEGKTSAQLDVAEKIAIALIKTGFVLDEDGNQVAFPLTAETVMNCPSPVIEAATTKFAELKGVGTDRKN